MPAAAISLQRTIGNRATRLLLRRPAPGKARQPTPRPDFVFIMGADPPGKGGRPPANPFYTAALAYWKAHLPNATFVTDKRDLEGVLAFLAGGGGPIGHVYIVSHANEDGTLSFRLDANDADGRLTVPELREALHPSGATSRLSSVTHRVDAQTRIHIKGCDIGRTQPMLELLDEAFGGAGTVDAPTHEQEYGVDPALEDQARKDFRAEVAGAHPMPEKVDPKLKGVDKRAANAQRDKAIRERTAAIAAELKARRAEGDERATLAGHFEGFSGPMFQRPGTQDFTVAELRRQVDGLYPHLPDKRRAALAAALASRDRSPAGDQHGQRRIRRDAATFTFLDPHDLGEAIRLFGKDFRKDRFTPTAFATRRKPVPGGFEVELTIKGRNPQGEAVQTVTGDPTPGDAELLKQGKDALPNPDSYAWRIEERHARTGNTTRVAVAERVLAYLHHESLDTTAHDHFTRPSTDPAFYATSTVGPPVPPKPPPKPVRALGRQAAPPAAAPPQRRGGDRAVRPARRLQRRPAPRPPSGLTASGPTAAYVKAAVDYVGDPANQDRSTTDYAAFLHARANDALMAIGVPATGAAWDGGAPFIGQFDANDWTVTMNPARFTRLGRVVKVRKLSADEAAAAAGTIYHEARHAEQHFRIARVEAARRKAGAPAPRALRLKPEIVKAATAQKLAATTADAGLIAEADEWELTTTGRHAEYVGIVDTWRNEVEAAHGIRIQPMQSDVAKRQFGTLIGSWRGARRLGFMKAYMKVLRALGRPGPVDAIVLTGVQAIAKAMDKIDAAWKKVEAGFDKAGLHARLALLQEFEPLLYDLGAVLDAGYHAHVHEADAFAAGDEVARQFLTIVNSP